MKTATFAWMGMSFGAVALAVTAPLVFGACSSTSTPPPPPDTSGGACTTAAGDFPPANCDDSTETCSATSPACPTAPCNASSPCLAMADNGSNTTQDFRFRKLNVTAPHALAQTFIQQGVIDQGVNLKSFCGEGGDGSFSWLVRFDTTNNKVTTGGAPPTDDPFGVGYCFVNATLAGLQVTPISVNMTHETDGTWTSDIIPKLNVPIYVHGDPNNVIVLPLSQAKVKGVNITGGNCIGSFNADGVLSPQPDNTCLDKDPSSCQRWHTAGSLGGYITLKEAEGVQVVDLGKTLCVLLTGAMSTTNGGKDCATDANGNVTGVTGDFCSTTDAPGGCGDSFWLAATFAASAAKINDGSVDPACNGSQVGGGGTEAGTEAGSGGDAGTGGSDAASE
jgi:hypothetical protein